MTDTQEVLRQVKKLEISTRYLVDTLMAGKYHSIFRGQGIEFSDIRDYHAGDDIRAIDWKVTARFNTPFLKEFVEERDLRVYFAFDVSASSSFGDKVAKRRKAIDLTATLMFSALRNNDNVGMFLFTDKIEAFSPARKGRKHVMKLLTKLMTHTPESRATDLSSSLKEISKVLKRRSIVFIISDFYSDDFSRPLTILRNRHDLIAIRMSDRREKALPDVGLIQLEDEETGEQILVDTSDEEFRDNYSRLLDEHDSSLKTLFRRHKIDSIELFTGESYEFPLRKFFNLRQRTVMR